MSEIRKECNNLLTNYVYKLDFNDQISNTTVS